jgi:murein DD-endopeptidase MepM/ murein hydrolase activator NlpD
VRRGQQIGTIGHMIDAAGKKKGPAHLHFELRCQYLPADCWGLSREDVLRYYLYPREYIATHRPGTAHLPESETATDVATLAQKARWWLEELERLQKAGDMARAEEIRRSLIRLLYRVENAAKG